LIIRGRKPFDDRLALQGIIFVLHTGIGWKHLPQEVGFGCGITAWRRLPSWREAGAWQRLHELLLAGLQAAGEIEWSRCDADFAISSPFVTFELGSSRCLPGWKPCGSTCARALVASHKDSAHRTTSMHRRRLSSVPHWFTWHALLCYSPLSASMGQPASPYPA
jgi:transposase